MTERSATVFVTGATGQDGSYLCERLLDEGASVHALHQSGRPQNPQEAEWHDRVHWHEGDLADPPLIRELVAEIAPTEVYNLGGISSVADSWRDPLATSAVAGLGAIGIYEAAWHVQDREGLPVRVVQASSAEIFGIPAQSPQDEATPVRPVSPYGAAKAFAHQLAGIYRNRGLGVSSLILYNHESPRRPVSFVTRKITRGAAEIAAGRADELVLGNLDAVRDWGWAPDYVDAMVRAARADVPDDFVIATGQAHSVRAFVEAAFDAVGLSSWEQYVRVDPAFTRPADPMVLVGDASHARNRLRWSPTVSFPDIVTTMVKNDIASV